ncbi:DUF3488 and transglutaminase-like domain-containing protein [Micromonospora zhanjiangensis]|uniref:DUF3488 and transglutaminase-like domain-containing protein n=1 Tax=Micromonospora zhanjiangensis TaxID=1522057 RepID=A0ABV8KXH3_9ACTN
MRRLRGAVLPLLLVALIGLAGAVLGRVYADGLLAWLLLGAAVGSVAVGVAARRLPSWLVAPLSVAALAGYVGFAVWFTARRAALPGGFGSVVADAAANGIPRLLTAMIPVEPVPDTVLVPLVAAWLAGLAGAEVLLRTGRVLLGYVPPALLYAGALYVVGPNADPAIWSTVAFAAVAATGLALRRGSVGPARGDAAPTGGAATDGPGAAGSAGGTAGSARSDPTAGLGTAVRLRVLAGVAAGLAVVVALAAVVGPQVAARVDRHPVDPRRYVQPPQVDSLDENPLIRISGWALNPDQRLFEVHTSTVGTGAAPASGQPDAGGPPDPGQPDGDTAATAGTRIRLAVLTDYDGVTWRVGATYRNAGRILPAARPNPGSSVDTVRQDITVADLTGRLLPAVATPRQVTGARVAYDEGSGTLIRPEGLAPGVRYAVTSVREHPDTALLAAANVPAGDEVARVLRVADGAPDQLRNLAEQLANDNGAPYARAAAIEQFLSEHYRLVADAPSGHAYPNLNFFLFGPRNGGGQRGTSEQFAAAYAVLGRLMGLPTRVVVGFAAQPGDAVVRGADAYAWPEVLFTDLGWVPFNPLPRPNTPPRPVEEDFKPKPEEPPPTPDEPAPTTEPTPSAPPAAGPARADHGVPTPVLAAGGTSAVLLVLCGLALTVVLLRRGRRRRRLTEGTPAQRIAGAWWEVTDALRLAGRPAPAHLAATEVAEHARAEAAAPAPRRRPRSGSPPAPPPPIDELADLVNLASFAPGTASDEQARTAGARAVAYADALRAGLPWWRRAVWSVHPGPLRWRRR